MRRLTTLPRPVSGKSPHAAPRRPETTADRVARVLVEHIRRNRLPAGAELPSEVRTSADLRVSRSIIREAYRSLSSAGIVDVANGRLPRVGRISHRALTQILQHALWTDQASATDILELRGSIEERAVELAAKRRTARDVTDLRRAVDLMRSAGRQAERYVRGDLSFHETIARAAGNPLFALVCKALRESIGMSMRVSLRGRRSRRELGQRRRDAHDAIATAIENGKGAQARKLMVLHFDDARAAVLRLTTVPDVTRSRRSNAS